MPEEAPSPGAITTDVPSRALLDVLKWRLSWSYPHLAATREPAKASVTALRRRAIQDEGGETWRPAFTLEGTTPRRGPGELDAAEVGTAHHRFIQHLDLASALDPQALAQAADRFQELGVLSPAERRALDLESIAAFWDSATGREIRAQAAWVQREIAFTARFATTELAQLGVMGTQAEEGGEVLVQGAADLVVLRPDEIWLLDFKTDRVDAAGVEAKVARYRPQLVLYSRAFERIYQCRVTKRWLHFLDARRTVDVADPAAAFAGETAPQPGARRSG
jgi:ATP-dependent helicase/nuclease subunit A